MAGDGNNYVDGGTENDTITAGSGADTILGEAGDDSIIGGGGADSINGGADNDSFLFSAASMVGGLASLIGDTGTDTLRLTSDAQTLVDSDFSKVNTTEVLEFANGANSGSFGSLAAAAGIDSIIGGTGSDTITQEVSWDSAQGGLYISGGDSADRFNIASVSLLGDQALGYSGDSISGGDGVDSLNVSGGDDTLGATLDNISSVEVLNFESAVTASLAGGSWGIETINGGAAADTLTVNTIDASGANSSGGIVINGVDNTIDSFVGGAAADTIQGATTASNTTNDTLTGGAGNDVFVLGDASANFYGSASGTGASALPVVAITDFSIGDTLTGGDSLRLNGNGLTSPTSFVTQTQGSTGSGDLVINLYDGSLSGPLVYFADVGSTANSADIYQITGGSGSVKIAELNITDPAQIQNLFRNTEFVV